MAQFPLSPYQDKTYEQVIISFPDYISWLLAKPDLKGVALHARTRVLQLITKFDSAPFTTKCSKCRGAATRGTLYRGGTPSLFYWWCDTCDPYSSGANYGKLANIPTYKELLSFIRHNGNRRGDFRLAVKSFAQGKGAPKRMSAAAIAKLFT